MPLTIAIALLATFLVVGPALAVHLHLLHGPIKPGNARWRREAPLRAARREAAAVRSQLLAHLQPQDLDWLDANGWRRSAE